VNVDRGPRFEVEVEDLALPAGGHGLVMVRIFRPQEAEGPLPVILFVDDLATDDRVARELAAGAHAAVLAREDGGCDLETGYELLRWISAQGGRRRLDGSRIAVVGGGFAAELVQLNRTRGGPALCALDALSQPGP
jgi:acetyl esterase/lipase